MIKHAKIITIFLFLTLIALTGCLNPTLHDIQGLESDNAEAIDSSLIIVGFSQLGSESDWRTANTKSIQNALVEENGFSLIFSNGRQSQANQIKDIRSFIFQKVDYIVFAPVTETGWDTVLQEAKEASIPVIIVDRMIETEDDSLYVACVGTDKYAEGQKAGLWLESELNAESIVQETSTAAESDPSATVPNESTIETTPPSADIVNIVILEGTPESTSQIERSRGFEDIALRNANWQILASESGDFTKAKGKEIMAMYLQEYKDIDVLVSQNDDMTFGAIEAIQEAGLTCGIGGQIMIISFDAVSEAFDKMESGLINVDIECNPLQGPMIADIIEKLEKGQPVEKFSYIDGQVFLAENAATDRVGRAY